MDGRNGSNYLTPKQSSPFEYSEGSQFDISDGQGTPDHDPATHESSPGNSRMASTTHELDSLDSLHLPSDINGDLTFTLSYNYQSSTLFLNIGKVYNLEISEKGRRKTEFYVKAYVLPDRWVVIVSIKAITARLIRMVVIVNTMVRLVELITLNQLLLSKAYNFQRCLYLRGYIVWFLPYLA